MSFTFTIDCFPAYTHFNKSKKVLATLQILDASEHSHNYADKTVLGHDLRESDNDKYIEQLYQRKTNLRPEDKGQVSIFDALDLNEDGESKAPVYDGSE